MPAGNPQKKTLRRDLFVALLCGAFVALIGGLSYAAVPFYSWLYRASGIGGTELAGALPRLRSPRLVTVRFDPDVAAALPWSFRSPRKSVDAKLGQIVTVYYRVTNDAGHIAVGQAGYNVSPSTVGLYFEKINCFCFAQQTMQRGESRDMAVVFYVDPQLADDPDQDGVSTITLSYAFYLERGSAPSAAESPPPPAHGPARLPGRI